MSQQRQTEAPAPVSGPDAPDTPAAERPIYTLTVRAEPGVDPVRALRWLLKGMLRQLGLRCVDIRREPPLGS